jgi:hypothetical protein
MTATRPLLRPFSHKLWTPGQGKPVGPAAINWLHPLAQGLAAYWWPLDSGSGYINLVNGDTTKAGTGTANVLPVPKATAFGAGPSCTTGTTLCESVQGFPATTPPLFSIACGFYQIGAPTATINTFYFGAADINGNDAAAVIAITSTTFGISFGNAASPFSFTFTNNTFYTVVGSQSAATTNLSWVNGIAQTAGTNGIFSGAGQKYIFGNSAADSSVTSSFANAAVFFGGFWNRPLTQADAILLYTDPYCFLLPLEPEMMIIQSAAVADILYPQSVF